jgi:2-oxoglutarate dehydrogenase E2 component (dihydrolipoamide succinyltransferase)
MPTQIVVPDLGESVIEATVARWLKQEGEQVKAGEPVLVLETDKVDLEVGADKDGVLSRIEKPAGSDVKVGDVLGVLDGEGAGTPAPQAAEPPRAEPQAASAPEPAPSVQAAPPERTQAEQSAPAPEPVRSEAEAVQNAMAEERVTPVARRMAEEQGVDISQISAQSPGGRVTKEDVERYVAAQKAPAAKAAAPAPAPSPAPTPAPRAAPTPSAGLSAAPSASTNGHREERVRMSRRRRTIAQRLVEAQHTAAMLTTFNEVDMTAVMDLRQRRKETFKQKQGVGLGLSSFFVKASIGALKDFPRLNAELQGDEIVLKHYYDIGVAIGAEEGLVVPVLRDADRMSFAEIEKGIKDFADKATKGTLSLEDLRGGTFTITNGGVFGSMLSTPILNPPQVGILGLHKIEARPIALNNEVVIHQMMYVALSYDHRIVDGREAVQFLVRLKELVEDPEALLLEG